MKTFERLIKTIKFVEIFKLRIDFFKKTHHINIKKIKHATLHYTI